MSSKTSDIQKRLRAELANGETYASLGRKYGVNRGLIWQIVNRDHEPKDSEIRRRLGLAQIVEIRLRRDARGRFASDKAK